jgi:hypothetical protein
MRLTRLIRLMAPGRPRAVSRPCFAGGALGYLVTLRAGVQGSGQQVPSGRAHAPRPWRPYSTCTCGALTTRLPGQCPSPQHAKLAAAVALRASASTKPQTRCGACCRGPVLARLKTTDSKVVLATRIAPTRQGLDLVLRRYVQSPESRGPCSTPAHTLSI